MRADEYRSAIEAIRAITDWRRVPFNIGADWDCLATATYEQAEYLHRQGRVSERAWRAYKLAWCWTASRSGGRAGRRHDHAYARLGSGGYWRRIDRAQALVLCHLARMLEPYALKAAA